MKGITKACFVASSVSKLATRSVARSAKSESELFCYFSALPCVVPVVSSFILGVNRPGPTRTNIEAPRGDSWHLQALGDQLCSP